MEDCDQKNEAIAKKWYQNSFYEANRTRDQELVSRDVPRCTYVKCWHRISGRMQALLRWIGTVGDNMLKGDRVEINKEYKLKH